MFTSSNCTKTHRTKPLEIKGGCGVEDRQSRIPGFSHETLASKRVLVVGAGGLGSQVGYPLVRKGCGEVIFVDGDTVHPTNLNRQRFYRRDLWKNKAHRLARNLSKEGFFRTEVTGVSMDFQEAIGAGAIPRVDAIISGVDNDLAREQIAEYGIRHEIPVITTAVSGDGDGAYCHVQRPGGCCWGCAFPRELKIRDNLENYRAPCPGTPAIMDILVLVSAAAVYALDTLFMDRPINWNYREFHLAGHMSDLVKITERRPSCQLCGDGNAGEGDVECSS